eukprot:scaffold1658_cov393-Prasinococcus_capsulatus_cf.AAC.10
MGSIDRCLRVARERVGHLLPGHPTPAPWRGDRERPQGYTCHGYRAPYKGRPPSSVRFTASRSRAAAHYEPRVTKCSGGQPRPDPTRVPAMFEWLLASLGFTAVSEAQLRKDVQVANVV